MFIRFLFVSTLLLAVAIVAGCKKAEARVQVVPVTGKVDAFQGQLPVGAFVTLRRLDGQGPTDVAPSGTVAADGEHLQKWLSNRLQNNVTIPDLRKVGYEFLGGRLLPAGKGLAAQFMYENNGGNRVTLYFAPGGAANTAFRYVQTDGLSMYYWRDAHFTYALSSELPRETLEQICEAVYGQINPGAPAEEW